MGRVRHVKVRLYTLHGSHPGITARLMLERKGIPYKLTLLPPGFSRRLIKRFGFDGDRTPAMKIDGRKIQGSTAISRELDRIQPDPPLFPADPEQRSRVEEAERWGDELQSIPRTIIWWAFKRDRTGMKSFLETAPAGARFGLPAGIAVKTTGPIINLGAKLNDANDEHVRAELAKLPGAIDQIDRWIEEGVLNGEDLTAADYQIAPSIRLLMTFDDLRPAIEGRPAGKLAKRVLPDEMGRIPAVFPQDWLTLPTPALA
jgi:glutathione S-transferase